MPNLRFPPLLNSSGRAAPKLYVAKASGVISGGQEATRGEHGVRWAALIRCWHVLPIQCASTQHFASWALRKVQGQGHQASCGNHARGYTLAEPATLISVSGLFHPGCPLNAMHSTLFSSRPPMAVIMLMHMQTLCSVHRFQRSHTREGRQVRMR